MERANRRKISVERGGKAEMGPWKWPRYARNHRRGLARIVAAKCSQRTTRCTMTSHSFISQSTTHVFVYIHIHVYMRVLFNVFRQIFASKNRMLPRWGKGVDRSREALRFYCQIDIVAMHFFSVASDETQTFSCAFMSRVKITCMDVRDTNVDFRYDNKRGTAFWIVPNALMLELLTIKV